MKVQTERRKQVREAMKQEHTWWSGKNEFNEKFLDAEMMRRMMLQDRPRSVPSSLPAFK